jgi:hypothetical protein
VLRLRLPARTSSLRCPSPAIAIKQLAIPVFGVITAIFVVVVALLAFVIVRFRV